MMAQFSGIQHGKKSMLDKLPDVNSGHNDPVFMPTPKQIREGCLEAQTKWSDYERSQRCVYEVDPVELRPVANSNTGQPGLYRRHVTYEGTKH